MSASDFWRTLGLRQNLYTTQPLDGDEQDLLVGRERELEALKRAVVRGVSHPSLDGANGVGKTSLITIANRQLTAQRVDSLSAPQWFPLKRSLNVVSGVRAEGVIRATYLEIAQTLVRIRDDLGPGPSSGRLDQLEAWLNQPQIRSGGGGATVLGIGATATRTASLNTTDGFDDSGLPALVLDVLGEHFPDRRSGGLLAVLENVELAGTAADVQALLDAMRDPLFNTPGLRWIICGANGVLSEVTQSRRLDGVIARPIELQPLGSVDAPFVIERRAARWRVSSKPILPVGPEGFRRLFDEARGNLRSAFRYCDDFTEWADEQHLLDRDVDREHREAEIDTFLQLTAQTLLKRVQPLDFDTWTLVDELRKAGGHLRVSASAVAHLDTLTVLRSKGLARVSITVSDDADATFTADGWLLSSIGARGRV